MKSKQNIYFSFSLWDNYDGGIKMEYIVLIPNSIKKNIIKEVRNKYYNYNIKFLSLEEFIEKYTFSYK